MFLFWYWFPRVTCYNRYCFFNSGLMAFYSLSFDRKSSFGFGIWNTILTFCGHSLTFFVYICLLLRFITESSIVYMMGRKSLNKDLNPGLDLNKRSTRKRKRNFEEDGLEKEGKKVDRGESSSAQAEAGPSNTGPIEAGPSNTDPIEASPSNSGPVETPSNIGEEVVGPSIGQVAAPSNIVEEVVAGSQAPAGSIWNRVLGRYFGARVGPTQPIPGHPIPTMDRPQPNEPWVGHPLPDENNPVGSEPVSSKTPSLVNTPGASPPEDNIPEGVGIPPEDNASAMDLF